MTGLRTARRRCPTCGLTWLYPQEVECISCINKAKRQAEADALAKRRRELDRRDAAAEPVFDIGHDEVISLLPDGDDQDGD